MPRTSVSWPSSRQAAIVFGCCGRPFLAALSLARTSAECIASLAFVRASGVSISLAYSMTSRRLPLVIRGTLRAFAISRPSHYAHPNDERQPFQIRFGSLEPDRRTRLDFGVCP